MPINPNFKSLRAGYIDIIRDFRAQGDGISDDTAAINTAINATSALGGGTVFMPEGHLHLFQRSAH